MASAYSFPVSAIPHNHNHGHGHGHGHHGHSHSHSPSFSPSKLGPGGGGVTKAANTSRALRQERSSSGLHSHSRSDYSPYYLGHGGHAQHNRDQTRANSEISPMPTFPSYHDHDGHDNPPAYAQSNGFETSPAVSSQASSHDHSHDEHDHAHHDHDHSHDDHAHHALAHSGGVEKRSRFTRLVMPHTERWSLLHSIMKEKDSRRIFYFMTLNFCFMTVQAFYGFLTDSLGLLSDSIHMFFDCLALALGLFAAVSSKWPSSERFPYGFGKIESLSGFGNGVFLMLISIEILIEAVERLAEGRETKRLTELLVVSSLGLAVNLVGMACFGHHHHPGHDHSHGGHDHGHSHEHTDSKAGACDHDHAEPHAHSHGGHSHENENMRGIFLHVLADTMGSAAVIVSTLLIQYVGWSGWDPLASCIIAVLIFLSSIPLVRSSAKKLLLTVPDDTEYQLRNTLSGVSDLRGVARYTVPRFWMADAVAGRDGERVLGVMHVVATRGSDLDDVRGRVRAYLSGRGVDVVLQVEKEGDPKCWCGGIGRSQPSSTSTTASARFS